ncbi:MAG: hypothetical protein PVG35_03385 [Desulfobacterales bacterium]
MFALKSFLSLKSIKSYIMETLPRPLDERVQLKEEPGYLMAAIR